MGYKKKRKDGSVRVVEQLNQLYPDEAPWAYVFTNKPHWLSARGTVVRKVPSGEYQKTNGQFVPLVFQAKNGEACLDETTGEKLGTWKREEASVDEPAGLVAAKDAQ